MNTWKVEATLRASARVEGSLAQALRQSLTAYDGDMRSYGPGGVSLTMHVEASASATAYVAAMSVLVTDVLPLVAGADLVDLRVSAHEHRPEGLSILLPDRATPTSRHRPASDTGPTACPQ